MILEGREVTALLLMLQIDNGYDMIGYYSLFLKNGRQHRAEFGNKAHISSADLSSVEKAIHFYENLVSENGLKFAALQSVELN